MTKLRPGLYAVLIAALIGALFFAPTPARADSWDFTASNGGWSTYSVAVGTPGVWTNGVGWEDTDWQQPVNNRYRGVYISKTLSPAASTVTAFSVTYDLSGLATNAGSSNGAAALYINGTAVTVITFGSQTNGTNKTMSWSGSISNVTSIGLLVVSSYYSTNTYAGSVTVKSATITATYPTATPTITPTPTNTPTATPTYSGAVPVPKYGLCTTLNDKAYFYNITDPNAGWSLSGGAARPYNQVNGITLPSGASAYTNITINPRAAYEIQVIFRSTSPTSEQYLQVSARGSPGGAPHAVEIPNSTGVTTRSIAAQTYGSSNLVLTLERMSDDPEIGLIVDYICLYQRSAPDGTSGGGFIPESCEECIYAPTGDLAVDMPQLFLWLGCIFRRVIECELLIAVTGIWALVSNILLFLASFLAWANQTAEYLFRAMADNTAIVTRYMQGELANVAIRIENALKGVVLPVTTDMQNVPIAISNGLQQGAAISNEIRNVGVDGLEFIGQVIGAIISGLGDLIRAVPTAIDGIFGGFNEAAIAPLTGAPTCASPGDLLYYPCLGFYILENTVFQGPALYIVPFIMAALAWDTLTWVVTRVREVLNK